VSSGNKKRNSNLGFISESKLKVACRRVPMSPFDIIGIGGVFLCLLAYSLNILQRIDTEGTSYPAINAVSSVMILISLVGDFSLAAALMEGSWLCVSLFAVGTALRRRQFA
jgi:hypothetical protein